jgi:hypothetical protein
MNSSEAPPPVERWSTLSAKPPCRGRQERRRAHDGSVGPVGGTEGVVHVDILVCDQTGYELGVVGFFTGVVT